MNTATYIKWDTAIMMADTMKLERRYNLAALIYMGIHLGLRYSDLSTVKWGQVLSGDITLQEKKTKKKRQIWVGEKQREWLNELYRMKSFAKKIPITAYVLANRNGVPFSRSYANQELTKLGREFGIEAISTHSLRKTFARHIYDLEPTDYTLILLSEVLNHSNIMVTKRYLGIRKEEIKSLYERL